MPVDRLSFPGPTLIVMRYCRQIVLLVALALVSAVMPGEAQSPPRYVLVLTSFEQQFSPHNVFKAVFRAELTERSSEPVQFIDVTLPSSFSHPETVLNATLDYLKSTFAVHHPDLIVTVGGVAALFVQTHRQQIFPEAPILFSSVDQRFVQNTAFSANETAVAVSIDAPLLVENILHVLPNTRTIAVVIGASPIEAAWRADLALRFEGFKDRVSFQWLHELSFEAVLQQSGAMPPNSAILLAHLGIDAQGIPMVEERALPQLRKVANAPIFGVFNSQLGQGIVGGPLLNLDELGRSTAGVALRMLRGNGPRLVTSAPQLLDPPAFDAAELTRWKIPDSRLAAGSTVRFRPAISQTYRTQLIAAVVIVLVEAGLVGGLLTLHVKRKRAERLRQESEGRFRLLADTAPVMIWMADAERRGTDFNRAWLEFTGQSIEQELGDGWTRGVHPDEVEQFRQSYAAAFDRREPFRIEYRMKRSDGEWRWVLHAGTPRFTPDGVFVGYTGSAIDVTDLRNAQFTLSTLSRRLMQAQEEERTRIARELHDDVCQRLAALRMEVDMLLQQLPAGHALQPALAEVSRQSAEIGTDIQALSHRLHSSKLALLGLPAAAGACCREMSAQHAVGIGFTHQHVPAQLPEEIKIGLFRVMQEALMNAVKHSGASQIEVSLLGRDGDVELQVVDHGVGFNPAEALQQRGLGLISMRERLALIGGELFVHSHRGGGTTIRAVVRHVSAEPRIPHPPVAADPAARQSRAAAN